MPDRELQFIYWLNRAATFNKEMKGKQMTEINEEIRLAVLRGRADERERIIKLLEDPVVMSNWWSQLDKNLGLYGNLKNYVIALIKKQENLETDLQENMIKGEK